MNEDTTNSTDTERREFSRIIFDADTVITQGQQSWSVDLIDISLKGLLISEPDDWEVNEEEMLETTVYLSDDLLITMEVTVGHYGDNRIGLICKNIDLDSMSHLKRLVELNVGDADLLNRELAALG